MAMALEQGALGRPSPNPHVGAIVVRNGIVVGRGHHEQAGNEHAEGGALREAGEAARGATLYVTLEPCNHLGKTPPCTEALINAGLERVVIGCRDPNPHVRGGGIERIRAAGIEVTLGVMHEEARLLIAPWVKYVTTGFPYVSLKLALSLDGRIATRTGESKWITGAEARQRVHVLRATTDGVGVGIGTAIADDPRLTVRDVAGKNPTRVVFDTKLRLALSSRLATSAVDVPTIVLCGEEAAAAREEALAAMGVIVQRAPQSAEGRIDAGAGLRLLAKHGIVTLMIEGGAELAGSILAGRFADELHAFLSPSLLGPRGRPGAVDWAGPDTPVNAPRIANPVWELCGSDAYVHGQIAYPNR